MGPPHSPLRSDPSPSPDAERSLGLLSGVPALPLEERVFAESVRLLYRSTLTGLLGSLVNITVIAALLWPIARTQAVLGWAAANLAVVGARGVLLLTYRQRREHADPTRWWWLFLAGMLASGAAMGSVAVVLFPAGDSERTVLVFLLLGGLLAGAVGLYAVSGWIFLAYGLPVFVPFVLHLLVVSGPGGRVMGAMGLLYLAILLTSAQRVTRTTRDSLRLGFANQDLARALEEEHRQIEHLNHRLRDLSLRDELTGLRNRRFIHEVVDPETELYAATLSLRASGRDRRDRMAIKYYGVYLLDVDHFKEINDRHGHDAGDAYLRHLGGLLGDLVRGDDIVARWGGEEFLVVLRETHLEFIPEFALRLLERVAESPFTLPDGAEVSRTVSVGCVAFPMDGTHAADTHFGDTVTLADRALYLAKRSGRNRAVRVLPGRDEGADLVVRAVTDFDSALARGAIRIATIVPARSPK